MNDKKYYWKMNGYLYEVTKEQYQAFKKEHDHHKRLEEVEREVVILSFDSLGEGGESAEKFIADPDVHIEEDVIHKMMIEKLRVAINKLSAEELMLIDLIYTQMKSEREVAKLTGIPQRTICYRKNRLLNKLKKQLEN